MKIVIIGSGNVATHMGKALKASSHKVLQVWSRNESSAKALAKRLSCKHTCDENKISDQADLYLIALRDEAIAHFLKRFPFADKIVVHTSGSVGMNVFGKKIKNCGVLYPVQTFSIGRAVDLKNTPFCIEAGNDFVKKKLSSLAKSLSRKIHYFDSEQRKKIHLAAVFANNFSNHLFAVAENILKHEHVSFDILRPIILETAMKVQRHSPLEMQTGPARRGDKAILSDHLKMLAEKKEFRKIYKLLSESISGMSGIRL